MEIIYFNKLDSTQKEILRKLENKSPPFAIFTENQQSGIGSRDNIWIGKKDNFFLSFVINRDILPNDLKIGSISIYFAWLLIRILREKKSKVWLKWPNDFYLDKKIGGIISTIKKNFIIIGIGLNSNKQVDNFPKLDINLSNREILYNFLDSLEFLPTWKDIFLEYSQEFYKNRDFFVTQNNKKVSLKNANLFNDGSIILNGERIFNNR